MNRVRIRGRFIGFPGGVWQMAVEKPPTRLVREATFIRDLDLRPLEEITTKGARQFGDVTLAEEGLLRLPRNDDGRAIETRVVLQDFKARFDEQLFADVKRTLDNAASGGELTVRDYRDNPSRPTVTLESP